jgi:IrrE N-terminal-like domain
MASSPDRLVEKLLDIGLSQELVDASLPDWWTPEDAGSASAKTLVALLLARRLNLDPHTLLDDGVPLGFLHSGPIKFKHMRLAPGERKDALVAFAHGVSRILFSATATAQQQVVPADARELRQLLMGSERPFVGFGDVLTACWSLGVPVLHLRLFPARTKGVTAIAVRIGSRHAILVARESGFEAQYMFHVAHELGHIALGHLKDVSAIIDADPTDPDNKAEDLIDDEEEVAADAYAQTLLTGSAHFEVIRATLLRTGTARELADVAMRSAESLGVDPGHMVMCFGYSSGDWALAMAASKLLPGQPAKPGTLVNKVMWGQLGETRDTQAISYLQAVAPV